MSSESSICLSLAERIPIPLPQQAMEILGFLFLEWLINFNRLKGSDVEVIFF